MKIRMKTKRAFAKRVIMTGSEQLKRKHAFRSHLAPAKTTKQKRISRKYTLFKKSQYKRAQHLLQ